MLHPWENPFSDKSSLAATIKQYADQMASVVHSKIAHDCWENTTHFRSYDGSYTNRFWVWMKWPWRCGASLKRKTHSVSLIHDYCWQCTSMNTHLSSRGVCLNLHMIPFCTLPDTCKHLKPSLPFSKFWFISHLGPNPNKFVLQKEFVEGPWILEGAPWNSTRMHDPNLTIHVPSSLSTGGACHTICLHLSTTCAC